MAVRLVRAELPSTQREAVRRARAGADAGTLVIARRQSAGRGRLDHAWASPPGGLYLSRVVRSPPETGALLALAAGVRLARAVNARWGLQVEVKWPNDLVVAGPAGVRKLAGILVDEVDSPRLGRAAVVGVGVNVAPVASALPAELRDRVVSLADLVATPPSLDEVETLAVTAVDSAVDSLGRPGGAETILAECRAALHGLGRRATVDGSLSGVITALGEEGELWLSTDGGPVAVRTGDLAVEET